MSTENRIRLAVDMVNALNRTLELVQDGKRQSMVFNEQCPYRRLEPVVLNAISEFSLVPIKVPLNNPTTVPTA